jgi:hypothetical protein
MITRAADWFGTDAEFRQVCGDAVSLARSERAEEFAADMARLANEHGIQTPLSERQCKWLCELADIVVPLKRQPPRTADSASGKS